MAESNPFFYYSGSFPKILNELNISLVFSTYQAGKVIFVSSPTGEALYKFAKNFKRPMGIDFHENRLAIASRNFIEVFSMSEVLARTFPDKPNYYDQLFVPQVKYYTGLTDMHDIEILKGDILAVNTSFSCISKMSDTFHFDSIWKPPFINELEPEDRCHLNGMVVENGKPTYVTFFDQSNNDSGWRKTPLNTGQLWDVENNEALLTGLSMPHSPLKVDDNLYVLCSATGEVLRYNLTTKTSECIIKLDSFLRGLDIKGHYMFIGASKMRKTSKTFSNLPITEKSFAGIVVIDLRTNEQVASLTYTDHIHEIYDVKVLEDVIVPFMLSETDEGYEKCIHRDFDQNYWLMKNELTQD